MTGHENVRSETPVPGTATAERLKVFLDDERVTPSGWARAFWPQEVIALLETGLVAEISLDHDLGDDSRGTGYDVVAWIEEAAALRGFVPPRISVHSANPAAAARMRAGIEAINRLARQNRPESTYDTSAPEIP